MSAKNTFCCCINHSPTAEAGASMVMMTEFSDPQGPLLLDFKFKYLHVQCKSLLLHLRNCTPKSKRKKYVGKCTDCSHPAAWQYLPSCSPIEWHAVGVLKYSAYRLDLWPCDFYRFGHFLKVLTFCTFMSDDDEHELVI